MSDSPVQRPAKRLRTDTSNAESPHGDPWLDDGNIILQAESTQFRVLRSILSASSSVFRDMFTVPQPANENLVDGCPVVHVSDTAQDLHHVLKALFDRSYCFDYFKPLPLEVIVAFLRVGRKYDIQQLYSEALTRLEYEFPSTLEGYDRSESCFSLIDVLDADYGPVFFAIINLARENDILTLLPAAFYAIWSHLDVMNFFEAIERSEESTHQLSVPDQRTAIKGRDTMLHWQRMSTFGWLEEEENFKPICTSNDCAKNRNKLLQNIYLPPTSFMGLKPWKPIWNKDYCKGCLRKSKELHASGRREIWDKLPRIFYLPGWEELKKQK